jgi:hypothetical protein
MTVKHPSSEITLQRRKSQGAAIVAFEDELHHAVAEAAQPII